MLATSPQPQSPTNTNTVNQGNTKDTENNNTAPRRVRIVRKSQNRFITDSSIKNMSLKEIADQVEQ